MVTDVFEGARNGAMVSTERFVTLLREKNEVTVLATGEEMPGKVVLKGFYVPLPFARRIMQKMGFIFAWPQGDILRREIAEADIVHIQFPFFLGMRALRIARSLGKPVVTSFHVQPENMFYNVGLRSPRLVRAGYRFFLKHLYNLSDVVICPSLFGKKELIRHGLTSHATVVSNGILQKYHPVKVEKKPEFENRFVIFTVGRLAREKRHQLIIRAIAASRHAEDIQLVIAGDGPLKDDIIRAGHSLPHAPVVGYVSDSELIDYYNMADLYVHASEVELESLTVLEAMGCGLPPIISDAPTSATGQFALDDRFLFRNGDAASLTERIDFWYENREKLKASSKEYLKQAEAFRIENSLTRIMSVYHEARTRREASLCREQEVRCPAYGHSKQGIS